MENSAGVLQTIKANHQSDVNASCTAMFEKWLKMNPDASWNQLVSALKNIDDMSLAIENLKEQDYQKVDSRQAVFLTCYATMQINSFHPAV